MMDLSDGLASDLPRLAHASGCGFTLENELIPCTRGCALAEALTDGEDYELLFAVAPPQAARLERDWKQKFPRLALTRIGELNPASAIRHLKSVHGHDHFA